MSTSSAAGFDRDLIGYGANPPHPQWPGGARIAINFVVNYEEGSEYSFLDEDGHSESTLTEAPNSAVPFGTRDLAAEACSSTDPASGSGASCVCLKNATCR